MPSWQYLKGYRDGAKTGPGYDHVTLDAVDRLLNGRWSIEHTRDDRGSYWRGYGAGFVARVIGVDLSAGRAAS